MRRRLSSETVLALAVLGVSTFLVSAARANTYTFNSASPTPVDWQTGANWTDFDGTNTTNAAPPNPVGTTDSVEIATGTAEYFPGESGGDFRLDGSMTIDLNAGFLQDPTAGNWMNLGSSANAVATMNVYGTFTGLAGGGNVFAGYQGSNATITLNVTGTGTLGAGGNFTSGAALNINNGSTVTVSNAGTMTMGGQLQIHGGSYSAQSGSSVQFNGVDQVAGQSVTVNASKFVSTDTYVNEGGAFNASNGSTVQLTTYEQRAGGSSTFDGSSVTVTGNNTFIQTASNVTFQNGATLNAANYTQNGGTLTIDHSTVTLTGSYGQNTTNGLVIRNGGSFIATNGVAIANDGTSTFSLAGAGSVLNISGSEFHVRNPAAGAAVMSGGTLNAQLISFDGSDGAIFDFSGGTISLSRGDFFDGIFDANPNSYVNFAVDSKGVIFLLNGTQSSGEGLVTSQRIRYDGDIVGGAPVGDLSDFFIHTGDGGVYVQLVPEPASVAMLGLTAMLGLKRKRRAVRAA